MRLNARIDGSDFDIKVKTFRNLCASKETGGSMVHSIRSLGSAALNLCAVAEGSLDVYWEVMRTMIQRLTS